VICVVVACVIVTATVVVVAVVVVVSVVVVVVLHAAECFPVDAGFFRVLLVRLRRVLDRVHGNNAIPAIGVRVARADHKVVAVAVDPCAEAACVVGASGSGDGRGRVSNNLPSVVAVQVRCVGLLVRRGGLQFARHRVDKGLRVPVGKEAIVSLQLYLKGSVAPGVDKGKRMFLSVRKRFDSFIMFWCCCVRGTARCCCCCTLVGGRDFRRVGDRGCDGSPVRLDCICGGDNFNVLFKGERCR